MGNISKLNKNEQNAVNAIENFLGDNAILKKNSKGDINLVNQNNSKKVRFDINNTKHSDGIPHGHVDKKNINGNWKSVGPHRINFKGQKNPNKNLKNKPKGNKNKSP